MKPTRRKQDYYIGEEPAAIPRGHTKADLKRLTEWLASRGHTSGWRRKKK